MLMALILTWLILYIMFMYGVQSRPWVREKPSDKVILQQVLKDHCVVFILQNHSFKITFMIDLQQRERHLHR